MMYGNFFAAAISVNGKILREVDGRVKIPFGSEYEFVLKNLNSVRSKVNITIDGNLLVKDLVLNAGQTLNLERSLGSNLAAGTRFKFIERTQAIEEGPRGIKLLDGIVEIVVEYEIPVTRPIINSYSPHKALPKDFGVPYKGTPKSANLDWLNSDNLYNLPCASYSTSTEAPIAKNEVGITVEGSISTQKFVEIQDFKTQFGTKLIFTLTGELNGEPISEPLLVKTKIECPTCGLKNKSNSKFCSECGTGLQFC